MTDTAGDGNGNGNGAPELRATRLRLHAQHQLIAVMRRDERVCRAEGLAPRSQIEIDAGPRRIQALLYQMDGDLLQPGTVALSETAWQQLDLREGDAVRVHHPPLLDSLASLRGRLYGHRLGAAELAAIVADVAAGRYSDVHLAAFLTATAALPLDDEETYALTGAMVDVGERLRWDAPVVLDKHCIGGLPGNRTSPLVVAIVAACGLLIPKTSSRAITSPAGTADTMETLAPVELDGATLRRVVAAEGGCLAWGGAMRLSPADEVFVRIERELDIDTEGQLIASVLSKKIAAGSTHVVIDIPVGDTAKVRTPEAGAALARRLQAIGARFGLAVHGIVSDGSQPVGRGIGPALE
ncbi:thymidine phosphorylase, partial [Tahibacter caeni]|uniref:thymidine phosphorylase n=1 Tax=Tahibacter caeni TaxID=1453545 RepID=UPI002148260D